jgi:hypothetical protein
MIFPPGSKLTEFTGGFVFRTFGGVSSFGPPKGDPIFAQENTTKRNNDSRTIWKYLVKLFLLIWPQTYKLNPKNS